MFKDKIRAIDIKAMFLLGICYVPAFIYRLFNKDIWLCSERRSEARDNGYWMYRYIRENHPCQKCYYVITIDSIDRKKIEQYKTLVNFGSLKHYFIFIAARIRMSAHVDADSPNFRVTNFMDRHNLLFNKRVYLQHGVVKDKISFGYYSVSKASLFVCAAKRELVFIDEEFGYPKGTLVLTGLPRYDGLNNNSLKKQILIMPTWRAWLNKVPNDTFTTDEYFTKYHSLLSNKTLVKVAKDNNLKIVFYMHPELQKYSSLFVGFDDTIEIASADKYDVQQLLNESLIMITDHSSVAFDFAFLKKPVVYYHFDYDKYILYQNPKGYFDYNRDGFGPVYGKENDVVHYINWLIDNCYRMDNLFLERTNLFFEYFDNNNCKRVYDEIKKI